MAHLSQNAAPLRACAFEACAAACAVPSAGGAAVYARVATVIAANISLDVVDPLAGQLCGRRQHQKQSQILGRNRSVYWRCLGWGCRRSREVSLARFKHRQKTLTICLHHERSSCRPADRLVTWTMRSASAKLCNAIEANGQPSTKYTDCQMERPSNSFHTTDVAMHRIADSGRWSCSTNTHAHGNQYTSLCADKQLLSIRVNAAVVSILICSQQQRQRLPPISIDF